jgi:segregation and condensation protein A
MNETEVNERGSNNQVFTIITGSNPGWQTLIYELISSEQLDPWDIDISALCKAYFEKIKQMEESNFFISSKILLAAALLLRIKSDILLNRYIKEIDNVLFNKQEEIVKEIERIEIDETLIPVLSPKTPLPRFKKVTLQELINALDVAIKTESRRINKEIQKKQAERLSLVDIPKFRRINIKDRIRNFYAKILTAFKNKKGELKIPYSEFTQSKKEEKLAFFLPLLYLSNHGKLWLEQETHFSEIYIYLYEQFKKTFPDLYQKDLIIDKEEEIAEELLEDFQALEDKEESEKKVKRINRDFENPIDDALEGNL